MTKQIILFMLLIMSLRSTGQTRLEAVTGGYIYHLYHKTTNETYDSTPNWIWDEPTPYKNVNKGLFAPMLGGRFIFDKPKTYHSISMFFTENCIGKNQIGFLYSNGLKRYVGQFEFDLGYVIGGYSENTDDWIEEGYRYGPKTIGKYFMPVIGGEFNVKYNLKSFYISVNTTVSLIIHNSFSIGVRL